MEENTSTLDIRAINEKIERESAFIDLLTMEMNKVIVGQKHMIERLLIGLLGQGHILSKQMSSRLKKDLFLLILYLPMRLTVRQLRYNQHC